MKKDSTKLNNNNIFSSVSSEIGKKNQVLS